QSTNIRSAFLKYVTTLFQLSGTPEMEASMKSVTVMRLERDLAVAQMSRIQMRDPYKTYNKYTLSELCGVSKNINWIALLPQYQIPAQDSVLVNSPQFFAGLSNLLAKYPLNDWKVYLQWTLLRNAAEHLSTPFVQAAFDFNKAQTGQKVQTPRWQRMSSLTDRNLGDLLGQLYVAKYFKPEAKTRMDELISNLRKAFEIRINGLEWMSAATKKNALAKLAAFRPKVGYTEKWRNYEGLEIRPDNYFANIRNAESWRYRDNIAQLGKPVDRTRFGMTPPTVNASYSATMNEIQFPAGILQFPFFDPSADDAVNYGGIGAVIGHEMSHGFDDTGSQYDKDGNLKNWWTEADRAKFTERTDMLVKQFNAYTVVDTVHVLGKLTLGENIGDLGGLNAAYTAFKMTPQGKGTEKIDGLTPDQRFFLSWA
ncbi:MAG: M13 family peptidase, partial [Sphingobacteriales bacterium]